jgi:hypothetical protein
VIGGLVTLGDLERVAAEAANYTSGNANGSRIAFNGERNSAQ